MEGTATETLFRIAVRFNPKTSEVRSLMEENAKEFPFMAMIGVTRIADGHIVAKAGSVQDDPDGRLLMELAKDIEFNAPFLNASLRKVIEMHSLSAESILDHLYESPVFDHSRRELLKAGIEAYLGGDHVKAIHVLIPQIEHSLRKLLGLLGIPTRKAVRNGTMQVKNLNDVLREEPLIQCLGEDVQLYFLTFLADQRGQNVRNRITHGLTSFAEINQHLADRILHVLLVMALTRQTDSVNESELPSTDANK